jgi:uncharacterized protein (TIGR02145 family)
MLKTTLLVILTCFISDYFSQNTVTDNSGNIYKTVKIGNQIWMAENLRTEKFNNGDPIEQISSDRYWQDFSAFAMNDTTLEEIYPIMCYYKNLKQKNSALYNWYITIDSRGVCPTGWHIPSSEEFVELINFLGGTNEAVSKLKSTSSWRINGLNSSGFNAISSGLRLGSGEFTVEKEDCSFWTDSNLLKDFSGTHEILGIGFSINSEKTLSGFGNYTINMAGSIRCLKN